MWAWRYRKLGDLTIKFDKERRKRWRPTITTTMSTTTMEGKESGIHWSMSGTGFSTPYSSGRAIPLTNIWSLLDLLGSLLPMREQCLSSYGGCWSVSSCSRLSWQCSSSSTFTWSTPGAVCHFQWQLCYTIWVNIGSALDSHLTWSQATSPVSWACLHHLAQGRNSQGWDCSLPSWHLLHSGGQN